MEYEVALLKAWSDVDEVAKEDRYSIHFLADQYDIDLKKKVVFSVSCNVPAPSHIAILILHYLKQKLLGLPKVKNEWMAFQELEGGQGYYLAFKRRVIDRIEKKYGRNPDGILEPVKRFKAKRVQLADISVVLDAFDNVPILIELWRGDEEFGPSANLLFDRSIRDIFCMEDVVVLAEFIASNV